MGEGYLPAVPLLTRSNSHVLSQYPPSSSSCLWLLMPTALPLSFYIGLALSWCAQHYVLPRPYSFLREGAFKTWFSKLLTLRMATNTVKLQGLSGPLSQSSVKYRRHRDIFYPRCSLDGEQHSPVQNSRVGRSVSKISDAPMKEWLSVILVQPARGCTVPLSWCKHEGMQASL